MLLQTLLQLSVQMPVISKHITACLGEAAQSSPACQLCCLESNGCDVIGYIIGMPCRRSASVDAEESANGSRTFNRSHSSDDLAQAGQAAELLHELRAKLQ